MSYYVPKKRWTWPLSKLCCGIVGIIGIFLASFVVVLVLLSNEKKICGSPQTDKSETIQSHHECCSGWERQNKSDVICSKAICSGASLCGKRGDCISPGECRCKSGYDGTKTGCNTAICSGLTTCGERGTCISPGKCRCKSGYNGTQTGCNTDIDECETNSHDCEQSCVNTNGSYHCKCYDGYIMNNDTCVDIDECKNSHPCEHSCVNTNGSYYCECHDGYIMKNNSCVPVCSGVTSCGDRGTCIAPAECRCKSGYNGTTTGCNTDIDECATNSHNCEQICVNTDGSYYCECHKGYAMNNDSCADINECETNSHNCEQSCVNTDGSYTCECHHGYTMKDNSCNPVCSDASSCGNRGECFSPGKCRCSPGYTGSQTGCHTDINECATNSYICGQTCVNTHGSYYCNCHHGYTMSNNNCVDINECASNLHYCDQSCVNTHGSYYCKCYSGYTMSNGNCIQSSHFSSQQAASPCKWMILITFCLCFFMTYI